MCASRSWTSMLEAHFTVLYSDDWIIFWRSSSATTWSTLFCKWQTLDWSSLFVWSLPDGESHSGPENSSIGAGEGEWIMQGFLQSLYNLPQNEDAQRQPTQEWSWGALFPEPVLHKPTRTGNIWKMLKIYAGGKKKKMLDNAENTTKPWGFSFL